MSVTTGKGDLGYSTLMFGRPVPKCSLRLEACGTVDELNAFLGLVASELRDEADRVLLASCQQTLILAGAELGTHRTDLHRLGQRFEEAQIAELENDIHCREQRASSSRATFLAPATNRAAALLNVCRTIARRAERRVWALDEESEGAVRPIAVYLNRLSDLLWLLVRERCNGDESIA